MYCLNYFRLHKYLFFWQHKFKVKKFVIIGKKKIDLVIAIKNLLLKNKKKPMLPWIISYLKLKIEIFNKILPIVVKYLNNFTFILIKKINSFVTFFLLRIQWQLFFFKKLGYFLLLDLIKSFIWVTLKWYLKKKQQDRSDFLVVLWTQVTLKFTFFQKKELSFFNYFKQNLLEKKKKNKHFNFYFFKKIKKKLASTRHLIWLRHLFCLNKHKLKKYLYSIKYFAGFQKKGHRTLFRKGKKLILKKILRILITQCYSFESLITSIEYNPQKKVYIAQMLCLLKYFLYYLLISYNLIPGMLIYCFFQCKRINLLLNVRTQLYWIPLGTFIFNITSMVITLKNFSFHKAKYALAPGTSAKIIQQGFKFTKIKLPSGALFCILNKNFASIGGVTNGFWNLQVWNTAGRSRHFFKKSHVRGVAMNAVDHPHGGGRGKTKGCSLTPWGLPSLNSSTRKLNKKNITWSFLIVAAKFFKKKKKNLWSKRFKTQLHNKIIYLQRQAHSL